MPCYYLIILCFILAALDTVGQLSGPCFSTSMTWNVMEYLLLRHGVSLLPHTLLAWWICPFLFLPDPSQGNPIRPLSFLPSYWLLVSLFTNQNPLGTGSQKLCVDLPVQFGGTLTFVIQTATSKEFQCGLSK